VRLANTGRHKKNAEQFFGDEDDREVRKCKHCGVEYRKLSIPFEIWQEGCDSPIRRKHARRK
jgi:hypothetical protein